MARFAISWGDYYHFEIVAAEALVGSDRTIATTYPTEEAAWRGALHTIEEDHKMIVQAKANATQRFAEWFRAQKEPTHD